MIHQPITYLYIKINDDVIHNFCIQFFLLVNIKNITKRVRIGFYVYLKEQCFSTFVLQRNTIKLFRTYRNT